MGKGQGAGTAGNSQRVITWRNQHSPQQLAIAQIKGVKQGEPAEENINAIQLRIKVHGKDPKWPVVV